MANLSQENRNIIQQYPLNTSLDHLHDVLGDIEALYMSHPVSSDGIPRHLDKACQTAVSRLLSALQGTEVALVLRPGIGSRNVASELARLFERVQNHNFSYDSYRPLVKLVIQKKTDIDIWNAILGLISDTRATPPPRSILSVQQTPLVHNTSSFANSTEYRKYVDTVLKEELGDLHADIPNFFEAYFGDITGLDSTARAVLDKCREGDSPLYTEDKGWKNWPETAVEKEVLKWLADVIGNLMEFTEAHNSTQKISRRPLARPSRPLEGSGPKRKLDIGFVDDLNATITSKCHWSQIIVPGELKCDPTYDRLSSAWLDLGRYAREVLGAPIRSNWCWNSWI
ncbi:hypothetical protein CIRG_09884 [Coccidioides immitis RMSCC 2394]|uniref:Fungal-type protein kinase domain-containing protein n=1 Tax=Coccidioides immitis RMSCC 2394 TaxID=404692 RepID=A0A0J6YT92_COCIT|nr:hypothetical protein CIRG_09884 [Coccidioides immitis RMSCC 2394]